VEASFGGRGRDARRLAELHYLLGRHCQSTRAIVTAHQLVLEVLGRWASPEQHRRWLPQLASGEAIGAFALTERGAGSNPSELTSYGNRCDGGFVIHARKHWVTSGAIADLVMVSVLLDGEPSSVLIPTISAGVRVEPVSELLGFRAAMVADLVFKDVFVPKSAVVGPIGAGMSAMVGTGLDLGRFVTAWGSVGLIARLLLEARSSAQQNAGSGGLNNPAVKRLLAEMYVGLESSRGLCERASMLRCIADPGLIDASVVAKYASAHAAVRAARNAIQIMGAAGCLNGEVAARFFRDAKILEIIEGPQELLETIIGGMWHDCFDQ
jgi:alkylation response protein AidB-like acyl-CoA dehydrogenase